MSNALAFGGRALSCEVLMNKFKFLKCLLMGIVVGGTSAAAQFTAQPAERGFCGSILTAEAIAMELERIESGFYDDFQRPETRGPGDYKFMRLALHIVRRTNGSGGISTSNIQSALDTANDHFAASRMVLTVIHLDYIDSDTYYTIAEPEDDLLRQFNVVSGALNIYFVGDAPYCGEATFPGDDVPGIVLQNSCIDSGGVLSHEIGHYFNLWHTHETAAGADCPGGAFCATRGDLCCDTPPDPGLHTCSNPVNPGSCVSGCEYTGTATCGGQEYSPDVTNTMSYTDFDCMAGFSDDQRGRIAGSLAMSDRVDEIMTEHPCSNALYVSAGVAQGVGTWSSPFNSILFGIAIARPCSPVEGGVLIASRGTYNVGPVLNQPVTILASRQGTGTVVELRP